MSALTEPRLLPHAEALLERAETTNVKIGDHVAPKSPDGNIVSPCAVLYLRPGGTLSGSICAPLVDAWLPFQFTCVGWTATQAMDVADTIHTALTSSPIIVPGRAICRVRRTYFGATAHRDNDVTPPLFYIPAEYRLLTTAVTEES